MTLTHIRAENVRCLTEIHLDPADSNLIYGENASGKTSLLEAIFILGRARSFRTANRETVIRDGQSEMMVAGTIQSGEREVPLGIGLTVGKPPRIRLDGKEETSVAALAQWLPVQIIDPEIHQLVDQGPAIRRKFVDWGVFHVEPRFLDAWRRYHRCLRQRNAALKASALGQLEAWDQELSVAGQELSSYRRDYIGALQEYVKAIGSSVLDAEPQVTYRQGWPEGKSLIDALTDARDRDIKYRQTHVGSHRSDLSVSLDQREARGRVSRGQQKLLAATLVLAQLACLRREIGREAILLLDDLAAELDRDRLERLRAVIEPLKLQLFMTALRESDLRRWNFGRVFHVEQGKVRSVV